MTRGYRDTLQEFLKDSEFAAEWEKLEPEYQIVRALLEARRKNHMTQQDLATASGIPQANISRLENGNANPSIRTLHRIADALGMRLQISLIPNA